MVVVDGGGSLLKPGTADDPQRVGKAAIVAAAMHMAGTDAMVISATDWQLGKDVVLRLVAEEQLPALAANLVCDGVAPFAAGKVVERGGRRIGVVGVTDGAVPGCEVSAIPEAVTRAMAELGPVDVRVLLLPTEGPRTRELLAQALPVDLVFDADPSRLGGDAERVGEALVLGTGPRGQRVGLTTLSWRGDGRTWTSARAAEQAGATITRLEGLQTSLTQRLTTVEGSAKTRLEQQIQRVEHDLTVAKEARDQSEARSGRSNVIATRVVELDTAVADDPAVLARVKAFLASTTPEGPSPSVGGPRVGPGGAWSGADTCAGCHPAETAQWLTTRHAAAWTALVDDGHAGDNDCFACHSTGARTVGGPATAADVGGLRDVQCEACHGPAQQHLSDPAGIRPVARPPEATCRTCHDGDRDGGRFDPATYLPKVVHRTSKAAP